MHSKQETERLERERQLDQQALESSQQTQHVMIRKLKLHIKQTEGKLCLATEELYGERSRNAKLSQDRTNYAEKFEKMCALTNELERERNKIFSKKTIQYEKNVDKLSVMNKELENEISKNAKERTKSTETLHLMTKELESERSRNVMLLKESNHYKEQLRELKQAHVELTNNHAIFRSEKRQSEDLRTATENNQQLELNLSDLNRSTEGVIGEMCSLNDKATKLTDAIERKDRDISKLQSELQKKNQEIEDIQGEFALIKESNEKNERLISDLHIKMSLYKRKFNETSPDSGDLTNTISHLEREVEGYKNELKMAREEMKHATEKIQQAERNVSDLKLSEHAWNEEVDSLNDQIEELTKKKENDISRLENKLQRKCQKIENTMTEVAMIKGQNKSNEQLITQLQIELDQNKTNFKDEHSHSAEMNDTITTLRGKVESYESELKQAREEIRNATVKSRQMDQKISATKISEQSLVDERDSLKDNVIELTTILKRRDSEIREMETKMAEFSSIKEKYIKFENDKSCHSAEMSRTISYLEREVEKNQNELKQAREETKRCALQLKSVNDEHGNCQNRIMSLRKENEKWRSMATYKGDQTKRSESVLSQREQELSIALEKTKRELREVQHDLEDTKTSKVMGQKLTDNNPNFADLSDKNRPTKLAERYSELYDNQWTDAFEVVNKQLHDEKSTIDSLIDILMTTAKFCRGEAMKKLEEIQGILLPKKVGTALPLLVHKNLKDCRKALGDLTGTAVYEKYMEENAQLNPRSPHQDVKPFVKECIELCWLMSIQDPPVTIEPLVQRGAKFDTDFYKVYTSSGPLVDYMVWPALCLHEKGPLLCKGIAQGYGGKKTKY